MPRIHITVSEQMQREIHDICTREDRVMSKFVTRGVQMAIDDARKRFGEAANDAPPASELVGKVTPRPAFTASAQPQPSKDGVTCFRRGNVTWFSLGETCSLLGITIERLKEQIDPEDDVLDYQGKSWIDIKGVEEARTLCADPALSESFGKFAASKADSTV